MLNSKADGYSYERKKGKKKDKKQKPVKPKYAGMEFDYELIGRLKRDELEWVAVSTRSDLDELRRERILMQMQRDYFNELIIIYLQKIRDARELPKLTRALRNSMVDEMNYMKGGLTDKMISNLDFAISVNTAASQMRQNKRQKRIMKRLEDAWRNILDEIAEYDRLARNRPKERAAKIHELEIELDNLNEFYEQANAKQQEFLKTLTSSLNRLYADLKRVDYLDVDFVELHYNSLIYEFLNMLSWRYFMFKSTATDNVHNILTGIMLMMEHWDQLEEDCRFMTQNLELYKLDTEGLLVKSEALKLPFQRAKIHHVQLDRLRRGLQTSYRSTRESEEELQLAQDRYKMALADFAPVEEERANFKAKLPFLTEDLWETYQERFKVKAFDKKATDAATKYGGYRRTHQSYYPTPYEANTQFAMARAQVQQRDDYVEQEKFRSMRILKQHDDMARSVRARVRTIGRHGWSVKYPPRPDMIGRRNGMGYAPAGLVAKRHFPSWEAVAQLNCKKCPPIPQARECYEDD